MTVLESKNLTVRITGKRRKELNKLADKTGFKISELVRSWIYAKLDDEKPQAA